MTTPKGDQPDWQVLVTPQIQSFNSFNQTGGQNITLFQSPNPFRVWGAWVSASFSSNNVYAAALNNVFSEIQDALGSTLLAIVNTVRVASQVSTGQLSIAIPGWTPNLTGALYTVALVSGASPANTDYRINGGIYISQP